MEKERGGKPNLLQARLPGAEHRSRDSQERAQKEEQDTLRYTTFRKKSYIRLDWNTAKEYYFRSMAKGLKLLVYCSSSSKLHHDTISFTYLPLKRLKIAAQCSVLSAEFWHVQGCVGILWTILACMWGREWGCDLWLYLRYMHMSWIYAYIRFHDLSFIWSIQQPSRK